MAKQPKTEKVKLTDAEFNMAVLSRDETEMNLSVGEFNIKMAKRAVELGLPNRIAARDLAQKEEELTRVKLNKKYYDKLVRDKFREVPVQNQ